MKLRNKKTGEIINSKELITDEFLIDIFSKDFNYFNSKINKLQEDWEDYEEPKGSALDLMILTLTNFIENEPDEDKVDLEDCKQMLEKLKAWKRLKDKCNFRFTGIEQDERGMLKGVKVSYDRKNVTFSERERVIKDLMSLFGGEE